MQIWGRSAGSTPLWRSQRGSRKETENLNGKPNVTGAASVPAPKPRAEALPRPRLQGCQASEGQGPDAQAAPGQASSQHLLRLAAAEAVRGRRVLNSRTGAQNCSPKGKAGQGRLPEPLPSMGLPPEPKSFCAQPPSSGQSFTAGPRKSPKVGTQKQTLIIFSSRSLSLVGEGL